MYTDFHTHIFHPKIADKVLDHLQLHYGIQPVGTGLTDDLLMRLDMSGIKRAVVLTAATTPDQVIPANNWSMHLNKTYTQLQAFGTLHPGFKDWEKELERLEQNSIIGLKFHPDFQGYDLADPLLSPIFEAVGNRFILMFHVGDRLPPDQNPSSPGKLAVIRKNFPDLVIVAAHLGGYLHWDHALHFLAGTDVFLDTSSSLPFISRELLMKILKKHSLERILFGSDYPLFDPGKEIELLNTKACLSSKEIETVLSNGARILEKF